MQMYSEPKEAAQEEVSASHSAKLNFFKYKGCGNGEEPLTEQLGGLREFTTGTSYLAAHVLTSGTRVLTLGSFAAVRLAGVVLNNDTRPFGKNLGL